MGHIGMIDDAETLSVLPAPLPRAIPVLPPTQKWTNVRELGVKGDGVSDDTAALQQAIATHRVLYFPSGHYVVSDTIEMKPDTVLLGLHPTQTQFDLLDGTPGYQGVGPPKPVLVAPPAGHNIVSGFGIFTGGVNPRAVGLLWKAGADSLVDDVRFSAAMAAARIHTTTITRPIPIS